MIKQNQTNGRNGEAPFVQAFPRVFLPYEDPATGECGIQFGFDRDGALHSKVFLSSGQREHVWEHPVVDIPPGRVPRPLWAYVSTGDDWLVLTGSKGDPAKPGEVMHAGTERLPWEPELSLPQPSEIKLPGVGAAATFWSRNGRLSRIHARRPSGLTPEHLAQAAVVSASGKP